MVITALIFMISDHFSAEAGLRRGSKFSRVGGKRKVGLSVSRRRVFM
jgi:hypothetical protein